MAKRRAYFTTSVFAALMAASYPVHSAGVSAGSVTSGNASGQANLSADTIVTSTSGATKAAALARGDVTTGSTVSGSMSNWDAENLYWRQHYPSRKYYSSDRNYLMYEPAYRYGFEAYNRSSGRAFDQLDQEQLRRGWEQARGSSSLSWEQAQLATRDAYMRLLNNRIMP